MLKLGKNQSKAIRPRYKSMNFMDFKKATQSLNYFATKAGGCINKMKAYKLIWLADRYHLRKFGRPIIYDRYYAMKHGPVASSVRDIANENLRHIELKPGLGQSRKYVNHFLHNDDSYHISSLGKPDLQYFSRSDLEAMDFVYKKYGGLNQYELRDLSHKYPEWKKFEADFERGTKRRTMSLLDFFEDPDDIPTDLFAEDRQRLDEIKEIFEEDSLIASYWK